MESAVEKRRLGELVDCEDDLKRAVTGLKQCPAEDRLGYSKKIAHEYAEVLKERNRESDLLSFYGSLDETFQGFVHLKFELYKVTGLYDDYVAASGAVDVLKMLAKGLHAASGGEVGHEDLPFASRPKDMKTVEAMLRSSVHKNAQSTSIYNQIMEMIDSLETRWRTLSPGITPEFYDVVKNIVDEISRQREELKADTSESFDMTPPAVSMPESKSKSNTSLSVDDMEGGLIGALTSMMGLRPQERPGSPNLEPCSNWMLRKTGKLRGTREEMARRISSNLSTWFIYDFHENKSTALTKFADNIEKEFESKPHFIVECLTELGELYRSKHRESEADIFLSRLEKYKSCERKADDLEDLPFPGVSIYIPEKESGKVGSLKRALMAGMEELGESSYCVGHDTPVHNRARPGIEFYKVTVLSQVSGNLEKVRKMVRDRMEKSELPDGVLVEIDGNITAWERS